jgi:hypothetical protein
MYLWCIFHDSPNVPPLISSNKLAAFTLAKTAITVINDPLRWNHRLVCSEFGFKTGTNADKQGTAIAMTHRAIAQRTVSLSFFHVDPSMPGFPADG